MIQHFLITVLVIYGVHASTRSGMILRPLASWFKRLIMGVKDEEICHGISVRYDIVYYTMKVLCNCTPCMASIYGTISFFMVDSFPTPLFLSWVVWVFSLCGFNYILNKLL